MIIERLARVPVRCDNCEEVVEKGEVYTVIRMHRGVFDRKRERPFHQCKTCMTT